MLALLTPVRRIAGLFGGDRSPTSQPAYSTKTIQWQATPAGNLLFDGQEMPSDHPWTLQELLDLADVCWNSAVHGQCKTPVLAVIAIQPGVACALARAGDITREHLRQATPGPDGSLVVSLLRSDGQSIDVRIQRQTYLDEVEFHTASGFMF